jgi:transposase
MIGSYGAMEPRKPYPTDLNDTEWDVIKHLVPAGKPGGRPEQYPTCAILEALFSILRGGGAWRLLPHDFPPGPMVSQYFWRWRHDGPWPRLHDRLRGEVRVAAGTRRQPSAAILARQSVQTTATGGAVGTMPANRSKVASVLSSSIPADSSSRWS